jgi:hypothetical protein
MGIFDVELNMKIKDLIIGERKGGEEGLEKLGIY